MTATQARTVPRVAARLATNAVIKGLAVAGGTAMVVMAPNSLQLIDTYFKHIDRRDAQKTIHHLKYRKLIEVKQKDGLRYYKLTKKGHDTYEKIMLNELTIKTPRSWDHKWRLVIFDIPESHRKHRAELLHRLKLLDFYKLQQSVWIHPFDCEKLIGALLELLNLEKYVSYVVVEEGNFTDHAESHFKQQKVLM